MTPAAAARAPSVLQGLEKELCFLADAIDAATLDRRVNSGARRRAGVRAAAFRDASRLVRRAMAREKGPPRRAYELVIPRHALDVAAATAPDTLRPVILADSAHAAAELDGYHDDMVIAVLQGAELLARTCRELLERRRE